MTIADNLADDIFDRTANRIQCLGLREIPFTESPIDLLDSGNVTLNRVFTGREQELEQVFGLFQSRERRRIRVYGRLGIGKSAFLLEVLSVLRRKRPQMLTTYVSLPANLDIATTALIAIAQALPNNDWAQRQLNQMGIPTTKPIKDQDRKLGVNVMGVQGSIGAKDTPIANLQYPTFALDTLLKQAQADYPDGVLIALDDLDKQEPRQVRQLLHDAQGVLKGRAWFMLTGHPMDMTSDLLTSERGLFDLQLPLTELDQPTTYRMLINYLNSARINNDCDDPDDPRSVLPFLPETAQRFCEVSLGKPRLFNRLGYHVLTTAAALGVKTITLDVLDQGLRAAELDMRQQAALSFQEEQIRRLLLDRGSLSDEDLTYPELQELGLTSFGELLPFLERLETEGLAYQIAQGDVQAFKPIPLPPAEEE